MIAIETRHLHKQFGSKTVLGDVSLQLEGGKIHGLVGDNGSSKSVFLKLLWGCSPVIRAKSTSSGSASCPAAASSR